MAIERNTLQRRELLRLGAGGGLLLLFQPLVSRAANSRAARSKAEAQYLAARQRDGRFEAVLLDAYGRDLNVVPLPARGHSFAIDHQRRRAVAFGRQPGFFALAFGLDDDAPPQQLPLPEGRHFFGHGCFAADGNRLFATENHFEAGRGVLGIYDATPGARWRRLGEYDCASIGPHEVMVLPDERTLCVANGGILTHPDYGKRELNLDSMRSSLAYIDTGDGRLLEQRELPPQLQRLSIRHLALAADGHVWFGCQYLGDLADQPPLVGRHRPGEALELLRAPADEQHALRGYIGSVSADLDGDIVATSSPVGGLTCYWRAADAKFVGSTAQADGCGVAPAEGHGRFLLSDGSGAISRVGPGLTGHELLPGTRQLAWDNHLRRV